MRIISALLKPLSFLPALCLMYMIFTFSGQDGTTSSQLSYKVSYKIVETGAKLLGEDLQPWEIDSFATRFHGIVRKLAHMTEYFALAVSVAFPLYVYGMRGLLLMIVAGAFCVAFACGDEYHQSFVAGRGPSKRDVAIDSFGVFWGIILVRIIGWTGRKTIFRPFSKDHYNKKKKGSDNPDPNYSSQNNNYQDQPYHPSYYGNPPYPDNGYPNYSNPPYPGNRYQDYSGQPYPGNDYPNQPYPNAQSGYYGPASYEYLQPEYEEEHHVSDKLSEDMSFRKLMHDLKTQKQEAHREHSAARQHAKKKPVDGVEIDEIDLHDDDES